MNFLTKSGNFPAISVSLSFEKALCVTVVLNEKCELVQKNPWKGDITAECSSNALWMTATVLKTVTKYDVIEASSPQISFVAPD